MKKIGDTILRLNHLSNFSPKLSVIAQILAENRLLKVRYSPDNIHSRKYQYRFPHSGAAISIYLEMFLFAPLDDCR